MKYCYKYPRPAITTDCVVFGFDGKEINLLLVRRKNEPYRNFWALPGGFLNQDEIAEDGALRELAEETGVKEKIILTQVGAFSGIDRDPRDRVISIAFYTLVRCSDYNLKGADDADYANWVPLKQIPPLAFDHNLILQEALKSMKREFYLNPMVELNFLDASFSFSQLHYLYTTIGDKNFDWNGFWQKSLGMRLIIPDVEPNKYCFNVPEYKIMKENGYVIKFIR